MGYCAKGEKKRLLTVKGKEGDLLFTIMQEPEASMFDVVEKFQILFQIRSISEIRIQILIERGLKSRP